MVNFDLTTEPWITCTSPGGRAEELSLRDVLVRAHEFKALANESPLLDASLLRLCLAVLHRCFESDKKGWASLRAAGRFDPARIDAYFETWRSRFDLFDAERPFFQVARLVDQSKNYVTGLKPAREMIAEQSAYGAPRQLFASHPNDGDPISFSIAARWLVAIQAFATGGLLSRDAANGDPTAATAAPLCAVAVVTIAGGSLFDTLLLNLLPYPSERAFPKTNKDAPAWELAEQPRFAKRPCWGWLDWLTWQSRRMQLIPHDDETVESFLLLNGCELQMADGIDLTDPMAARRYSEAQKKLVPVAFLPERAVWRDSTALYQVAVSEQVRCARVVEELIHRDVNQSQELSLQIYGQRPNKASVVFTRAEVVPLPVKLIESPELVAVMRDALAHAEDAQRALRGALYLAFQNVLSLGERKPQAEDVGALIENSRAIPTYWNRIKSAFDEFLFSLVETEGSEDAATRFCSSVAREARASFHSASLSSSSEARALKAFTLGSEKLQFELLKAGVIKRSTSQENAIQAEV